MAYFLARPTAHGGPMLEHSVPEGLYAMEMTHAGACYKCKVLGKVNSLYFCELHHVLI